MVRFPLSGYDLNVMFLRGLSSEEMMAVFFNLRDETRECRMGFCDVFVRSWPERVVRDVLTRNFRYDGKGRLSRIDGITYRGNDRISDSQAMDIISESNFKKGTSVSGSVYFGGEFGSNKRFCDRWFSIRSDWASGRRSVIADGPGCMSDGSAGAASEESGVEGPSSGGLQADKSTSKKSDYVGKGNNDNIHDNINTPGDYVIHNVGSVSDGPFIGSKSDDPASDCASGSVYTREGRKWADYSSENGADKCAMRNMENNRVHMPSTLRERFTMKDEDFPEGSIVVRDKLGAIISVQLPDGTLHYMLPYCEDYDKEPVIGRSLIDNDKEGDTFPRWKNFILKQNEKLKNFFLGVMEEYKKAGGDIQDCLSGNTPDTPGKDSAMSERDDESSDKDTPDKPDRDSSKGDSGADNGCKDGFYADRRCAASGEYDSGSGLGTSGDNGGPDIGGVRFESKDNLGLKFRFEPFPGKLTHEKMRRIIRCMIERSGGDEGKLVDMIRRFKYKIKGVNDYIRDCEPGKCRFMFAYDFLNGTDLPRCGCGIGVEFYNADEGFAIIREYYSATDLCSSDKEDNPVFPSRDEVRKELAGRTATEAILEKFNVIE